MAVVSMKKVELVEILLEEITSATNNFNDRNCIGDGGFGKVYKGSLPHFKERSMVAFKRLDRMHGQGDVEFLKEIRMLSRYRHDNLISLLGFCKQGKEMILVYEHASHGSLERHLSSVDLTWKQRLNICLGAAKGLHHLHDPRETGQRLIHCDIKSANILLDDEWNAKVADFGLSKIAPANHQNSILVTSALGTVGYCDPLFMETYTLTKESDVYSFGVVLFEVLCGRVCTRIRNRQLQVLVHMWKKSYEQKKLDEIICPHLRQNMDPTSLESFTDIAFQCLKRSREERPLMSRVVEILEGALKCQEEFQKLQELEELKQAKEYETVVNAAVTPLIYKSIKELKLLLSKGFLINGGTTWFYVNDNGQHCELISIKHCYSSEKTLPYVHDYNSRFRVGSLFALDCKFKVRVRAQFLTPMITYSVNLVFKFENQKKLQQKQPYIRFKYILQGEIETSVSYFADKRELDECWMVELCQFTSEQGITTADLQIIFDHNKPWIVVEGIEFLPVEKEEHQVLEDENMDDMQPPISSDDSYSVVDTYRQQKLPIDYGYLIKLSKESMHVLYLISKGLLINDGQQWLSVDKNGNKRLMLSSRVSIEGDVEYMKWQFLPELTRFGETVELGNRYDLKIESEIRSELLEPETKYATYLVYKLPIDQSKFEAPLQVIDGRRLVSNYQKEWEKADNWYVFLISPKSPVINVRGGKVVIDANINNPPNPLQRPKLKDRQLSKKRKDGWMEVQIWEFLTPPATTTTPEIIHVCLKLEMPNYDSFDGLIVEGIEFRPIYM